MIAHALKLIFQLGIVLRTEVQIGCGRNSHSSVPVFRMLLPFALLARSHGSGHRFISERRLALVSSRMLSKPHSFTSMANMFSSTRLPRNLGWGSLSLKALQKRRS